MIGRKAAEGEEARFYFEDNLMTEEEYLADPSCPIPKDQPVAGYTPSHAAVLFQVVADEKPKDAAASKRSAALSNPLRIPSASAGENGGPSMILPRLKARGDEQ